MPQVYDSKNAKVSDAYVTESKKTIEKQIQKAGIRLAAVLQICSRAPPKSNRQDIAILG
ncbi:hypothetical protein ACFPVY_03400 [Flavobacterium qiangtangense]|uniref:Uncharacterized protein n=1 Tax=Flavobacterium qiangtangense TaxID=1442595 RepID=A0ABW1PL57_9FLAO